jgi:hypothetical protein
MCDLLEKRDGFDGAPCVKHLIEYLEKIIPGFAMHAMKEIQFDNRLSKAENIKVIVNVLDIQRKYLDACKAAALGLRRIQHLTPLKEGDRLNPDGRRKKEIVH